MRRAVAMVSAESSRGGSKGAAGRESASRRLSSDARHAQGAVASRGEGVGRLAHLLRRRHRPVWPGRGSPAARPWRRGRSCRRARTSASARLRTGSNGLEMDDRRSRSSASSSASPARIAASIASGASRSQVSAPASSSSCAVPGGDKHRLAQRQLVAGQRAGLVARTGCPCRPSPRSRRGGRRSPSSRRACEAPTAMVTDSTAGSATGIAATVRIRANSSVWTRGLLAEQRHHQDQRDQAERSSG